VKKTLVEEVMTRLVVTATEAMPFRDLVALLYARDIGAVPVLTLAGQVVGMVSNRDLIAKAAGLPAVAGPRPEYRSRRCERLSLARTAGELMTTPAITVPPLATIEEVARLMRRRLVGRLPVTSPFTGQLAGIVSRSDLLRIYRRPGEEIRAEILAEVVPQVPGADPRRLGRGLALAIMDRAARLTVTAAAAGG
jgi:CBS domain-containing protein